MPPVERRRRQCQRCPGRPLLVECHHSKKARLQGALLSGGDVIPQVASEPAAPALLLPQTFFSSASPSPRFTNPNVFNMSQGVASSSLGPSSPDPCRLSQSASPLPQRRLFDFQGDLPLPSTPTGCPPSQVPNPAAPERYVDRPAYVAAPEWAARDGLRHEREFGSLSQVPQPTGRLTEAEPPRETPRSAGLPIGGQPLAFHDEDEGGSDIGSEDNDGSNLEEGGSEFSCGKQQPSSTSAKPSFVEGAMKGNYPYLIKRTRPLRQPYGDSKKSSQRFARVMKDIIIRAENLSIETGCWLYVVGQHVTAATPFIHYVSPRFRADATKEVNIIHNNFSRTISALVSSRRRAVADVAMELDETKAKLAEFEQQAKLQQEALERQRAQLAAQAAQLALYRSQEK